jgi:hypothetical protein
MNEHVMLEIARQRAAERQESARLTRLAREQRAVDRARRGQRGGGVRGVPGVPGVPAQGGGAADWPAVPDYVDGTFATDRQAASAGRAAARR